MATKSVKEHPVAVALERVEYLDESGKLVTESLRDYSRKAIRRHFASLDAFLRRWHEAERKESVIAELAEEGLLLEPLQEEVGKDLDPFDLICHIAFDQPPLSRRERATRLARCNKPRWSFDPWPSVRTARCGASFFRYGRWSGYAT